MKNGFYTRLAADNIKRNGRLYLPRILAEAGLLGCFYILVTLAYDRRLAEVKGGAYLPTFMTMAAVVLGLLSLILILYINRFLTKQRTGEYGLYHVLGMEKRHVVKVFFFESLFSSLLSVGLGVFFGMLFYKLSSLLICRLLRVDVIAGFYYLSAPTVLLSAAVFFGLDLLAFSAGVFTIRRLKPIELLSQKHAGEPQPKTKRLLLFLGILTLGAGYGIALTVKSPLQAVYLFFEAVILVIIGTYCLFVTGTTFVLQRLKKNKVYYYNKKHMPAVAGLEFRMKHNAVGLASIAILATGVLVMISTTVSLYAGIEDAMEKNYPRQFYLSAYEENDGVITHFSPETLGSIVRETAEEYGVAVDSIESERTLSVSYLLRDGKLLTRTEAEGGWAPEELTAVLFITERTYARLQSGAAKTAAGQNAPDGLGLAKDEIAYCRISSTTDSLLRTPETLTLHGTTYRVKEELFYFPVKSEMSTVVNVIGVVVSDENTLQKIYLAQKEAYGKYASEYTDRIGVSFADEEAISAVGTQFNEAVERKIAAAVTDGSAFHFHLDTKWESLHNVLGMNGTFLFLGILLGFVCLFSTILILYYKQISEGYADRERFQIMEKIGMEPREVKKTIGSQLVLQFFLPLATAAVHTAVAFPILLKLLKLMLLTNTSLMIVCTLVTLAVFALVYTAVYYLTAKTYYQIVH